MRYYCSKCRKYHTTKSNIGKGHARYKPGRRRKKTRPNPGGDIIAYHGTTSEEFDKFIGVSYFTPDFEEAKYYAVSPLHNIFMGGSMKGKPRILKVRLLGAKTETLDWNDEVFDTIMEESEYEDLDDAIISGLDKARKEGYRFISFYHPSSGHGDEHLVYVPVDNKYIEIISSHRQYID